MFSPYVLPAASRSLVNSILANRPTRKRLQAGLVWRSAATCRGFPDVTKDDVHKILTYIPFLLIILIKIIGNI